MRRLTLSWCVIMEHQRFRHKCDMCCSVLQMTSVFLHAFPALVAWAGRWHSGDPNHWKGPQQNACQGDNATATVRELILVPWAPYALWAVAYYLKIFVVSSQRIQDRGYHTLFKYTTRKPNSLGGKIVKALPRWVAPIAFMANHVLFCAVTFTLTWLMWSHYWLNTLFLIWCISMSAWNGGNYYFEVFAHKYVAEVGISKPVTTAASESDVVHPRPHSLDGVGSADDEGVEVRAVGRSHSDGALTSTALIQQMELLEEQVYNYEAQQMNGVSPTFLDAGSPGRDASSVSSHPAGEQSECDPGVFEAADMEKVSSYPLAESQELPVTPDLGSVGPSDDGLVRRRVAAE
jgi:hypothetical protein